MSRRLALLFVLFGVALLALAPFSLARADEPPFDPNIIIGDNGWIDRAAPSGSSTLAPSPAALAPADSISVSLPHAHRLLQPQQPGSIIGVDDRTRVEDTTAFPFSAIAQLVIRFKYGFAFYCTGWFVGPSIVITAGHCIYDHSLGWAKRVTVYPGLNGSTAPFGKSREKRLYSVAGWVQRASPAYDYGAILLNAPLGAQTGWFGAASLDDEKLRSLTVAVTGYPGDKPFGTLWTSSGRLFRITLLRLFYTLDTFAGQSGSPVYNQHTGRACRFCAVGVHGYGVGADPTGKANSGIRVTDAVLDNLNWWRSLAEP